MEIMQKAHDLDKEAFAKKQPAFNKLLKSKDVFDKLKKQNVQEEFISNNGLLYFAMWLDKMDENTYPNINLMKKIFDCINQLNVDADQIEGSELYEVLKEYTADT